MIFDLAILGGGPAGYVAAERAGKKGLKVVLFEKKKLGGVCLNEGCIPTKTLLYQAKLYEAMLSAQKYGIQAERVTPEFSVMTERKDKIVRKLVGGVAAKMKQAKVEVVSAYAHIKGRGKDGITLEAEGKAYTALNLLICTGSEAILPEIPGLDPASGNILTSREILDLKEIPSSLAVIGGGVVGTEFASLFNSLGTKVSVIELLDKILGEMDEALSAELQQILTKKGIAFHLSARLTAVKKGSLEYEKDKKKELLKADKILFSVGRKPNTDGFGLENLGVEIIKGGIKVNENMQTNIPNVYAAGDVTGKAMLAHTASREGEVVVNHILGLSDRMRYRANPWVVYTNPEFACVGLDEKTAREKGIAFKVTQLPMTYAGRYMAENENTAGTCKVLTGKTYGEVLGVHILGNPASELIFGAAMAIESELTLKELREIIFPHPTVSEILRETIFSIEE